MSIDEMIVELEEQKLAYTHQIDLAISNLRGIQQLPAAGELRRRALNFRPIRIEGEPLSQTIIRDRGSY